MSTPLAAGLAGLCGDYCGKCPNYPQECAGCIPSEKGECHFVACCTRQGIEHCGHCADLPCAKLSEFCPDDREECPPGYHIKNLRRRMAVGNESWIAEQQKIWGK